VFVWPHIAEDYGQLTADAHRLAFVEGAVLGARHLNGRMLLPRINTTTTTPFDTIRSWQMTLPSQARIVATAKRPTHGKFTFISAYKHN
jgi:hypothetical protein